MHTGITLFSAYTPLKTHIYGIRILCILRFAKNCTHENKDTTFDHQIAKFYTRKNFCLYGIYLPLIAPDIELARCRKEVVHLIHFHSFSIKIKNLWKLQFCSASKAKCHIGITLSVILPSAPPSICLSICHALLLLSPHAFCRTLV